MLNRQSKYLTLSFILVISFLEVVAQQLPEDFDYSPTYIRIPTTYVDSDFKVLKGEVVDDLQRKDTPAIIGTIATDSTHTTFTPLVQFDHDTPYTLIYNQHVFYFKIDRDEDELPLTVTGIYPNTKQVPANILKWYIEFSKPVNPVKIYDHIQFLDQDEELIDRSILNLGAPLLSPDGKLLTVWVEPGRQKRLLGPNQHLGSVFESDRTYTLLVSNSLKDKQGMSMEASISHSFTTIKPDRIKPSIQQWQVGEIPSGTVQPLVINCEEILDYGSLLDAISINYEGKQIDGKLRYNSELKKIIYTPKESWQKGKYTINIEHQLEDLAGNNLAYLFDRNIEDGNNEITQRAIETLAFRCD